MKQRLFALALMVAASAASATASWLDRIYNLLSGLRRQNTGFNHPRGRRILFRHPFLLSLPLPRLVLARLAQRPVSVCLVVEELAIIIRPLRLRSRDEALANLQRTHEFSGILYGFLSHNQYLPVTNCMSRCQRC